MCLGRKKSETNGETRATTAGMIQRIEKRGDNTLTKSRERFVIPGYAHLFSTNATVNNFSTESVS
jgi:hypothetical protein